MVTSLSRNILSTYAVRFATLAAGLLLFPIIAGSVGLTRYGLWLISSSIGLFFALDLGVGVYALRQIALAHAQRDDDTLSRTVSTSLAFFAGLGLLLCSLYLGTMVLLWPTLHVSASDTSLAL